MISQKFDINRTKHPSRRTAQWQQQNLASITFTYCTSFIHYITRKLLHHTSITLNSHPEVLELEATF